LDVVDRIEHESAAGGEHLDLLADLPADIVRCPEGKGVLGVDPSSPER
jgi:hypothetical protein